MILLFFGKDTFRYIAHSNIEEALEDYAKRHYEEHMNKEHWEFVLCKQRSATVNKNDYTWCYVIIGAKTDA